MLFQKMMRLFQFTGLLYLLINLFITLKHVHIFIFTVQVETKQYILYVQNKNLNSIFNLFVLPIPL